MNSFAPVGHGPIVPMRVSASIQSQRSRSGESQKGERQKQPQSRQLLSCTKCRERKVKCDRTKPCSACCARGYPKDCEFIVGEGNDYSPIQQSYEIRKLRTENQRLKERLQRAKFDASGDDENDDDDDNYWERRPSQATSKFAASRQRRLKMRERVDNLYFGAPCLANVVQEFASIEFGSHSLTHTVPRGRNMYLLSDTQSAYPFPIMQGAHSAQDMAKGLLRSHKLIYESVEMLQRRAPACYLPHAFDGLTRIELERFLMNGESNAEKYPDMLALVFATVGTGLQIGVYDKHGGWIAGAAEETKRTADVYLAASMQALRLASFMNSPTLLTVQALTIMGPYLINSGRFLDAWTLFGTTIRLAHSIGLHRNPKLLDPTPPVRERRLRRMLWWWMLHMDQQFSVTLGRPLGISGLGDCPPPEPTTTNPTIARLGEFGDHFTVLARHILSSDGMMNVGRIDEFTDKLVGLWDTMPQALQFNESWVQPSTLLPDWPLDVVSAMLFLKVQSFLILLNRQRAEHTQPHSLRDPPALSWSAPQRQRNSIGPMAHDEQGHHTAPLRGRALVISSSVQLLRAFMFFYHRNPAVLVCWMISQQAFNACMILILDALETESSQNEWLVENAYVVFLELRNNGVHKPAELMLRKISDGITLLSQRRQQREQEASSHQNAIHQDPASQVDAASTDDFPADTAMGTTGMFPLEDPGVHSFVLPSSQPFWCSVTSSGRSCSAHASSNSDPNSPDIPSPIIPISRVTAAPFPVMCSPPFTSITLSDTPHPTLQQWQQTPRNLHKRERFDHINNMTSKPGTPALEQTRLQPLPQGHGSRNNGTLHRPGWVDRKVRSNDGSNAVSVGAKTKADAMGRP